VHHVNDDLSRGLIFMTLDTWMTARDMTDGEMADAIGVSREYVRLLRAGRRNPSLDVMRRIGKATGGAVRHADFGNGRDQDGAMGMVHAGE
jgi:transcriptional regulator with XRE-family HTH domain